MQAKESRMAGEGTLRLSKSTYIVGLQCAKRLWWTRHEPDAPELVPGEATQAIFDQGHEVGARARGFVPGGVLVDTPGADIPQRVEATVAALRAGARVVYEAAFAHGGVVAIADILERDGTGWTLTEVKSSTRVKDEHLPDLAVQTWVLRGAGVDVRRAELMHLNRECRYPDLGNLFTRADRTAEVEALVGTVPGTVALFREVLAGPLPAVPVGDQCTSPWGCPFRGRCWAGVPADSVWTLYGLRRSQRAALLAAGVETIAAIPASAGLTSVQGRQRRAILEGRPVVEPGLARALATLGQPVAYLDFETIAPAIPVWNGMRPYDQAPVQVSVHVEEGDGTLRHLEWLAEGPDDPREDMARRVIEFTAGAAVVVVYHAAFERSRLDELAQSFPQLAPRLARVASRLWDLEPVVREHVYHPAFGGGFSLKAVYPALVPGGGYDDLEVTEGDQASRALATLLLRPDSLSADERSRRRRDLLAYCARDTEATVRLVRALRKMAAVQ